MKSMTNEERVALKKAVDSDEGLLSPATMINSYSGGRRRIVEVLVSHGYLQMVPEEISTGKVINFYRVTESGLAVFYPPHKKVWFALKGDVRTVTVSVITALVTTVATIYITKLLTR